MVDGVRRAAAPTVVLIGAVFGIFWSFDFLTLVKELQIGCHALEALGSDYEWYCPDGVGYVLPSGAMEGTAVLVTLLGVMGAARTVGRSELFLVNIAMVGVAVPLLGTLQGSAGAVRPPPGESGVDYWVAALLPVATLCAAALAAGYAAAALRGRVAVVLLGAGAALLAVAVLLESGVAITAASSAAILAAAALRAASPRTGLPAPLRTDVGSAI